MARRLAPEESALWKRVAATVAPIRKAKSKPDPVEVVPPPTPAVAKPIKGRVPSPRSLRPTTQPDAPRRTTLARATLDGHWDRRLRKGQISPDMTIDLHGHSLASAHALLDASLARALARGVRVVLVIAGRIRPGPHHAPPDGAQRPRGAIRAALNDWLATSARADAILATRPAAPVHGGGGAVYVVLRRPPER